MGLADRIRTLEVRHEVDRAVADKLATAYARMAARKSSQRLFWAWFDRLANLLRDESRAGDTK